MTEIAVRRGLIDDAEGVARVQTLGWRQGFAGLLPADYLAGRVIDPAVWTDRLSNPQPRINLFVAVEDATIVGFAFTGPALDQAEPAADDLGQLYAIYLLEDFWGTGAGYRLHRASIAAMIDNGFNRAVLWVLKGNEQAIGFYRRQGWVDDHASMTESYGDSEAELIRMRHDLPRPAG
jgi:GNAT superfamily N-acetyltransferase